MAKLNAHGGQTIEERERGKDGAAAPPERNACAFQVARVKGAQRAVTVLDFIELQCYDFIT